ncbi:hypothetical protein AH0325V1_5123 (plasmid) [Klebsiella pneumoniae]|nr:hypothetical protein AH0325V1_5123 [Klebsiella pneumoniae]CAE6198546.1 hypothetical protein AI2635V1_5119 [Klebsiella pneumoniae]CAH2751396.1 hypothetical protein AH0325V1_5123 [Klebsiella pneumoniae]CAH3798503.1 hypothetical protein AI2635V1_5119 [Klebsiella pneumoniae]
MLLLTNEVQEVQMFFVLVQYVINQLLLVPAHHIIILTAFFEIYLSAGNDSNLLIVFYVQIMPDDLVIQLHRF